MAYRILQSLLILDMVVRDIMLWESLFIAKGGFQMARKFTLLFLAVILLLGFAGCDHEWMPQDGDWYCKELQLQISFSGGDCFWINNGETIPCDCINDRSSKSFFVIAQAFDNKDIPLGTELFCGEHVKLTDNEFVVREMDSVKIYTFTKVDATPD